MFNPCEYFILLNITDLKKYTKWLKLVERTSVIEKLELLLYNLQKLGLILLQKFFRDLSE